MKVYSDKGSDDDGWWSQTGDPICFKEGLCDKIKISNYPILLH